jgi:hypothetical protein
VNRDPHYAPQPFVRQWRVRWHRRGWTSPKHTAPIGDRQALDLAIANITKKPVTELVIESRVISSWQHEQTLTPTFTPEKGGPDPMYSEEHREAMLKAIAASVQRQREQIVTYPVTTGVAINGGTVDDHRDLMDEEARRA